MELPISVQSILFVVSAFASLVALVQIYISRKNLEKRKKELEQKEYETLVLREIGERIGYELNISKILDTIIYSLDKLVPFSVVSFMLISQEGFVNSKVHLAEPVNRSFLNVVKKHCLEALNGISPRGFMEGQVKEIISGAAINDEDKDSIGSLWVTPLTINSRGIGALVVASKKGHLYEGKEMLVLTTLLAQANRAVNNLEMVIATEQKRIDAMVVSMTDGIMMFDREFNLLTINPAATNLLSLKSGVKATVFDISQSLSNLLDLRAKIEESYQTDKPVVIEELKLSGKICQVLVSNVKDRSAKIIGAVVILHDISAQKELESTRDDFIAMMVHELRAPLTVIKGTVEMVVKNPSFAADPRGIDLLKTTGDSVQNLLGIVNDLLDASKINSGRFQINKVEAKLNSLIEGEVRSFQIIGTEKNIKIETNLPEKEIVGNVDKERIVQVLNNLLSNALKFTSSGGTIIVSLEEVNSSDDLKWRFEPKSVNVNEKSAYITVSDTGVGIAENQLSSLFSKYHQLDPAKPGTGLGLVITKGIVESHGGQMFVESRVNEGTAFHVIIPLFQAQQSPIQA